MMMRSALSQWTVIHKLIQKADIVYLFLDYDGTLTPIVQRPELAVCPAETRDILQALHASSACKVAVVSGRSLPDIKSMVAVKGFVYVGNHGYEIDGPGLKFTSLITPEIKSAYHSIQQEFKKYAKDFEGTWIEDKGATLSVHYRQLPTRKVVPLKLRIRKIVQPFIRYKTLKLGEGKKVLEIKPFMQWDKGEAVSWILKQQQYAKPGQNILPIYIGDDVTDEDAFLALRKSGVPVLVADPPRRSHARYVLAGPPAVKEFLSKIHSAQSVS